MRKSLLYAIVVLNYCFLGTGVVLAQDYGFKVKEGYAAAYLLPKYVYSSGPEANPNPISRLVYFSMTNAIFLKYF